MYSLHYFLYICMCKFGPFAASKDYQFIFSDHYYLQCQKISTTSRIYMMIQNLCCLYLETSKIIKDHAKIHLRGLWSIKMYWIHICIWFIIYQLINCDLQLVLKKNWGWGGGLNRIDRFYAYRVFIVMLFLLSLWYLSSKIIHYSIFTIVVLFLVSIFNIKVNFI